MNLNILVFPCGSEIALELHRSLKYSRHITLFGANSIDDHGKFIYENYIDNVPFYNSDNFLQKINEIVKKYNIDAIYPAMDSVIAKFSEISEKIDCKIIGSNDETNQICLSKLLTYKKLKNIVKCPKIFEINDIKLEDFPLFIKPKIGYGSRGATIVRSIEEIHNHLLNYPDSIITEFLPGAEFTIDCFTDRKGELKFYGPRKRNRISNGISVNTKIFNDDNEQIKNIVNKINKSIK
ncbi:MAG: ATP-grasp domain-containing protein, partial [Weeksellaceae bacterium]|nr:ATP-grasp domain-containing protein [Weeksellaceae bacterium]